MHSPEELSASHVMEEPKIQELIAEYVDNKSLPITPTSGVRNLLKRGASMVDIDPALGQGLGEYIATTYGNIRGNRRTVAESSLALLSHLHETCPETPSRASHFIYLPLDREAPIQQQFGRVVRNAEFMCNIFGPKLFTASQYYRAPLNDDFAITVKGGSGSGAFAVDFAIEANKYHDGRDDIGPSHELWRVGMDTSTVDSTPRHAIPDFGRIVRTGSGVKASDSWKQEVFTGFRKEFGTTPQRVLTFIAAHAIHELGLPNGLALSTHGAFDLSSLKKSSSECPTPYSDIHMSAGFSTLENDYWHSAPEISNPENFYRLFVARNEGDIGIRPHERDAVNLAIIAFNNVIDTTNGGSFPLKLCQRNDKQTMEAALRAYMGHPRTST